MDDHLREIELIELVAGHLDASAEAAARAHLARCPRCAARHEQAHRTWRVLGHWHVESPAPAVIASPWSRLAPLRVAAMVAGVAGALLLGGVGGWLAHDQLGASEPAWHVWHETTPTGLAEPVLAWVLEDENEESAS